MSSAQTAVASEIPRLSSRKRRSAASSTLSGGRAAFGSRRLAHRAAAATHLLGLHGPALEGIVTGSHMVAAEGVQLRLFDVAVAFVEPGTARVEAAAARRIDRARDVAFQHDGLPRAPELRIRDGHSGEQSTRVRVLRLPVERGAVGEL